MPNRVVLTRQQSVIRFGNPYGDSMNMFLRVLNGLWRARKVICAERYPEETQELDRCIKAGVAYLREHEIARPWEFNSFTGYSFKDLSESMWEGHWSNF